MKIFLTDGSQRSALAVTRSLGRAGMEIHVGETRLPNLASSSRYCLKATVYPSPVTDENGFLDSVTDFIIKYKIDMVIPVSDITSAILSENKKRLEEFTSIATVDHDTFWSASDKITLHRIAEDLGIPTPTLYYIDNFQQINELVDKITFPCVLKPARSRLRLNNRWIHTSVRRLKSREDLMGRVQVASEMIWPAMIQKEIHGDGYGLFALCDHGEPKALFAHHRLREKPPWGGVSVLRESISPDPVMREYAVRLLKHLRWHGVAMVEFKKERNTGTPYLMEINGRFWGSLQLAIDSGIDFPCLLVRLYAGNPISAQFDYPIGIRSRWFLGDIDHLFSRMTHGQAYNTMDLPSRGRLIWDFLKFYQKNTFYEVESWDDPGPSLCEVKSYVKNIVTSVKGRLHSKRMEHTK